MATTTSAARFGLRSFAQSFRQPAFRQNMRFAQRRAYSSPAEEAANIAGAAKEQTGFGKLWNSPVGPKTVHFWAPIMKWGLVLAGASDFARPASTISLSQNAALVATGLIWTRWCFVIKPRNLFLASVNFLLFCVGTTQVTRVLLYQQSLKGDSMGSEIEAAAKEEGAALMNIVKHPESVVDVVKGSK